VNRRANLYSFVPPLQSRFGLAISSYTADHSWHSYSECKWSWTEQLRVCAERMNLILDIIPVSLQTFWRQQHATKTSVR